MKSLPKRYSGLLPQKGWPVRNFYFLKHRIVPAIFKKPSGDASAPLLYPPAPENVRITWIGHASFFIQFSNSSVIIDPNWAKWHGPVRRLSRPGLLLEELPEIDLVLVTHAHFDHLHKPSLKVLQAKHGIVVPQGSAALVKKLKFTQVHEMELWEQLEFENLSIIHTPAHHWGARFIHDTERNYGGYIVRADGINVFHCGDSAYFDQFHEIGKLHDIDIALMPIGAYDAPSGRDVHMNPEEAIQAFLELKAKVLIPMHYATFPLGNEPVDEPIQRLKAEAARLDISHRIIIPEAGQAVEF